MRGGGGGGGVQFTTGFGIPFFGLQFVSAFSIYCLVCNLSARRIIQNRLRTRISHRSRHLGKRLLAHF
jgi:hypothetical protein